MNAIGTTCVVPKLAILIHDLSFIYGTSVDTIKYEGLANKQLGCKNRGKICRCVSKEPVPEGGVFGIQADK